LVEMMGVEPTTSAMRMPRSSQLSYIPTSKQIPTLLKISLLVLLNRFSFQICKRPASSLVCKFGAEDSITKPPIIM
jgi:hypothetical protein